MVVYFSHASRPLLCRVLHRTTYTTVPGKRGYNEALNMYLEGINPRRIARLLPTPVSPQTVSNLINAYHASLPLPEDVSQQHFETIEMDELFIFKNESTS